MKNSLPKLAQMFANELVDQLKEYKRSVYNMTSVQKSTFTQKFLQKYYLHLCYDDCDGICFSTTIPYKLSFICRVRDVSETVTSKRTESFFGKVSYQQIKKLCLHLSLDADTELVELKDICVTIPWSTQMANLKKGTDVVAVIKVNANVFTSPYREGNSFSYKEHYTVSYSEVPNGLVEFRTLDELLD